MECGMHFSLPKKISILSTLLIFLLISIGLYSSYQLLKQRDLMAQINELWLPAVSKSAELNINMNKLRLSQLEYLAADSDSRVNIQETLDEITSSLFIYFKVFDPLVHTDQQKKLYENFKMRWSEYSTIHDNFTQLVEEKKIELASTKIMDGFEVFSDMNQELTNLTDVSYMEAVKAAEASQIAFKNSQWMLGVSISVSLLLSLIISILMVRDVKNNLARVGRSLDETSESLKQKSMVLSSSSQELSAASTESAASLQETVASIEELTATVKSNANKASQASLLSDESQAAVGRGRDKLTQMIQSMNEVASSSEKIDEIVAMIDDIAFQTNLLALNAAVEAARAGEQGRGFAVVAEAVRSLAQKSADSAREIKNLIIDSKTKTETSVQLATSSNQSLEEIVLSVEKLATLIKEVAEDSLQQKMGIDQVALAMNQIDRATQELNLSTQGISSTALEMDQKAEILRVLVIDLQKLSGVTKKSLVSSTDAPENFFDLKEKTESKITNNTSKINNLDAF